MSDQKIKSEFVNRKVAKWLKLNYGKVNYRIMDDYKFDPITQLTNYLDVVLKTKDGNVKTLYKRPKGLNFGRYYCYINNKFQGLQTLCREFRQTLCKRDYYDIDIVNCHPTLLLQYCEKNNIECTQLKNYVNNRDELIKQLCNKFNKSKGDIKQIFLMITFGGKIPFEYVEDVTLNAFYKEMKDIQKEVAKLNKKIYEYVRRKKDEEGKFNVNGSITSYVLQGIECQLMLSADAFFAKNGYSADVYMFDGIQVRNTKKLTPEIMTALCKYTRDETKYAVSWVIKDMTEAYDITDEELDDIDVEDYEVVENDTEAALYIKKKLDETKPVIKSNGRFFLKQANGHIYKEDKSRSNQDTTFKLLDIITNENICKEVETKTGDKKVKPYSKNAAGASSILKLLMPKIEDDPEFNNTMWLSNIGKICFKNGYWNFRTKQFYTWDDDEKLEQQTYSPFCINRDFPEDFSIDDEETESEQWIREKVIEPIFIDEKQRTYFLEWASRCIAGEYIDKSWAVGLGNRNCGKGVLTTLFTAAFGEYCNEFNAEELVVCRMGCGDAAKKLAWTIPFEYTRLNISNELKTHDDKDRSLKLDGNGIKSIASGGDRKKARLNFKDEIKIKFQGSMLLMMNEMVDVQPPDALENVVTFNFNSEFKLKLAPEDIRINAIPNNTYKIQLADPKIKESIESNADNQLGFIKMIIKHYKDTKPEVPEEIKELNIDLHDTSNKTQTILEETFEFTKDVNDVMSVSEVNSILEAYCKRVSKSAFKLAVNRIGVIYTKRKGERVYVGIKTKK